MYNKVQLLLSFCAGHAAEAVQGKLAAEGQRGLGLAPRGCHHRLALRLVDERMAKLAHAEAMGASPPSFDVVFEIGGENADLGALVASVKGFSQRLEGWVEPARSAALAGVEHVIVAGSRPLLLVYALRRLPRLSADAFHDYWLHTHAEMGRRVPGQQGYRQFHADAAASRAAAEAAGVAISAFDGAAEAYYQDVEAFLAIMARPEITADALADERNFIDHTRSVMGLYRLVSAIAL